MILEKIIDQNLYQFVDEEVSSWEDAITISCQTLIKNGIVDNDFPNLLIEAVKKHGPYIVLMPNLAIPHTTTGAKGVTRSAIAFTKFKNPIVFDENDSSKNAQVFFTLAALDEDQHLENMAELFTLVSDEKAIDLLMGTSSKEDLIKIIQNSY